MTTASGSDEQQAVIDDIAESVVDDILGMLRSISRDTPWLGLHKEPLIFGAILFFLICFAMSKYSRHLEAKLSTDHKQ